MSLRVFRFGKRLKTQQIAWATTVITAAISTSGCAKRNLDKFVPGKTTAIEVRAQLGEPEREVVSKAYSKAKVMTYPNGCGYQIENNIVVGIACPPAIGETRLQDWRHKWKGKTLAFEQIVGATDPHGHKTFRLVCEELGMAVIYDESDDQVIRVVTYGSR